jgi:hypothetical protein
LKALQVRDGQQHDEPLPGLQALSPFCRPELTPYDWPIGLVQQVRLMSVGLQAQTKRLAPALAQEQRQEV